MTTMIQTAPAMANVKTTVSPFSVTVESTKTGKSKTISTRNMEGWSDEEGVLVFRLIKDEPTTLSHDDMRVFLRLAERLASDVKEGTYAFLDYDIHNSGMPNPSARLWRVGFRYSESVWCIPLWRLPEDVFTDLQNAGCTWGTVEIASHERQKIRARAKVALETEVHRVHGALIKTMADASEQYKERMQEEGLTPRQIQRNESYRNSRQRTALKTAKEALEAMMESAMLFDETESLDDCFKGLREGIRAQSALLGS